METQYPDHAQKDSSKTKMVRWRGSDAGQMGKSVKDHADGERRLCMKNSTNLSFTGKRIKNICNRGREGQIVHNGLDGGRHIGAAPQEKLK